MRKALHLFLNILLFVHFCHKFSLGHPSECDENPFINSLANVLHLMGVGYPILIMEKHETVAKFKLNMLIKTKTEWPTQQMDVQTWQIARQNGIPFNSSKLLDMEKIVANKMVRQLAQKFHTLFCSIRYVKKRQESGDFFESEGSNSYSSRSVNYYGRENISDHENANRFEMSPTDRKYSKKSSSDDEFAFKHLKVPQNRPRKHGQSSGSTKYDRTEGYFSAFNQPADYHENRSKSQSRIKVINSAADENRSRSHGRIRIRSGHEEEGTQTRLISSTRAQMQHLSSQRSSYNEAKIQENSSRSQSIIRIRPNHDEDEVSETTSQRQIRIRPDHDEDEVSETTSHQRRIKIKPKHDDDEMSETSSQGRIRIRPKHDEDEVSETTSHQRRIKIKPKHDEDEMSETSSQGRSRIRPDHDEDEVSETTSHQRRIKIKPKHDDDKMSETSSQGRIRIRPKHDEDKVSETTSHQRRIKIKPKHDEDEMSETSSQGRSRIRPNHDEDKVSETASQGRIRMRTDYVEKNVPSRFISSTRAAESQGSRSNTSTSNDLGITRPNFLISTRGSKRYLENCSPSQDKMASVANWTRFRGHHNVLETNVQSVESEEGNDRKAASNESAYITGSDDDADIESIGEEKNSPRQYVNELRRYGNIMQDYGNESRVKKHESPFAPERSDQQETPKHRTSFYPSSPSESSSVSEYKSANDRDQDEKSCEIEIGSNDDEAESSWAINSPSPPPPSPPAAAEHSLSPWGTKAKSAKAKTASNDSPSSLSDHDADHKHNHYIPRFYTAEEIASRPLIPLIECEFENGVLNAFVRLLYTLRLEHSKALFKIGLNKLEFNLRVLMFDDDECDRIEKHPLDDIQLTFAQENCISVDKWHNGTKTLNLASFMMQPFCRHIIDSEHGPIWCQIIEYERKSGENLAKSSRKTEAELSKRKSKSGDSELQNSLGQPTKSEDGIEVEKQSTSSVHPKYGLILDDCTIAEQLMNNWVSINETNRNKKIGIFIKINFIDKDSNGKILLEKMERKKAKNFLEIIENFEKIFKEKTQNEQTFARKIGEKFDKFLTLMEQTINENCENIKPPSFEDKQIIKPKSENLIEYFWEETETMEIKNGEKTEEKLCQKIAKQLINQLTQLRLKFDKSSKKGSEFIELLEDLYYECSSSGLKWKISKISEALKWRSLREVALSLRVRKTAMINAWRRVAELRNGGILSDLVERAEEAFRAIDRLLEALHLIEIGTDLKEKFEQLDGDGEKKLNQAEGENKGGGEFYITDFFNFLEIFEKNGASNVVIESRIMLRAVKTAIADKKCEVEGGIWDPIQSRKFETPEAIIQFVQTKNSDGSMNRLLSFLDELSRTNHFDLVRKFAEQVDFYRDDPREEVHELWRKFSDGADWIHRLNHGRKLIQFILCLRTFAPKYVQMNRLKAENKKEQLEEEIFFTEAAEMELEEEENSGKDEKSATPIVPVLKSFQTLELETIYGKIKDHMLVQFEGWWKRVPEQKEPLYELYRQLEHVSTRYVMALADAFFDGTSIESFRQEYFLGTKDPKPTNEKDCFGGDNEQNKIIMLDKMPSYVISESKAFFDHFFTDQRNGAMFDKETNRFNLNNFMQTFDKSMQITKFITEGMGKIFMWSRGFLSAMESASSNDYESPLYLYEINNSVSAGGKKKKFRKPLPPVLSKQTLQTIVKVIRMYEMKYRHNNISQMSDQKILDVHWRKVREALDNAKAAKRRNSTDSDNDPLTLHLRTSSNEGTGAMLLRMYSMGGDEMQMNEKERKESLDKIEALVNAKRMLMFALFLHRKYARGTANFGPIDAAFFEVLRDIRRETERWILRKREIKRLYRVCRNLNRTERMEIMKLVDAYWRGQNVDKYLEKRKTKREEKRKEKGP